MNIKNVFSSFSVDDLQKAKQFYSETLGVEATEDTQMDLLNLTAGATKVMVYPKENHQPATFTVLNFVVNNIDQAVDELVGKGLQFEKYEGFNQDEKGIARSDDPSKGPTMAWFKDPAGNILSLLQD